MINGTNKLETVKQAFRHWRATRTKRSILKINAVPMSRVSPNAGIYLT
ncbi:hypothetical protein [Legionella gratiana]|nr:hypothetical protein [Legionella gratiana]